MAAHADMHQPPAAIPSAQAAFDGLLCGRSVYSDSSANPFLATFTSTARVSLPKSIHDAPYLRDVAPPHLRDLVNGPVQRMLRSEEEYAALVTRAPLPEPYLGCGAASKPAAASTADEIPHPHWIGRGASGQHWPGESFDVLC